jgi:hypothetical protein
MNQITKHDSLHTNKRISEAPERQDMFGGLEGHARGRLYSKMVQSDGVQSSSYARKKQKKRHECLQTPLTTTSK